LQVARSLGQILAQDFRAIQDPVAAGLQVRRFSTGA
jgi:hypothetical protein